MAEPKFQYPMNGCRQDKLISYQSLTLTALQQSTWLNSCINWLQFGN